MQKLAISVVAAYRYTISPFLAPACRFTPSCSEYAMESIERFGLIRGIWFSIKRIGKCHPFHSGGYDPVPTDNCSVDKVLNK